VPRAVAITTNTEESRNLLAVEPTRLDDNSEDDPLVFMFECALAI